jgi:hypothetical protein
VGVTTTEGSNGDRVDSLAEEVDSFEEEVDSLGEEEENDGSSEPRVWPWLRARGAEPIVGTSVQVTRSIFGFFVAWEMFRYFDHDRIRQFYVVPKTLFTYWPFTFVHPLPLRGLELVFLAVALGAVGLIANRMTRPASIIVATGLTYIFLLDQTRYLNHFYLLCLIGWVFVLIPPGRAEPMPTWALWLLRFQVGVPYFFGGIAKVNGDWLTTHPLASWLEDRQDFPLLGGLFTHTWLHYAFAYGALFLDLFGVPLLLMKRTRLVTFIAFVAFHEMNARLFSIGVFPWFMIAATTVFFDANWPQRALAHLRARDRAGAAGLLGAIAVGTIGATLQSTFSMVHVLTSAFAGFIIGVEVVGGNRALPVTSEGQLTTPATPSGEPQANAGTALVPRLMNSGLLAMVLVWVVLQCVIPLRHFAIPGEVSWTEEGHNFSWHMKLRDKAATAQFRVVVDGRTNDFDPNSLLESGQVGEVATRPQLLVMIARATKEKLLADGARTVEVYATVDASLNGRPSAPLVDPSVDLASVGFPWFGHATWISKDPPPFADS